MGSFLGPLATFQVAQAAQQGASPLAPSAENGDPPQETPRLHFPSTSWKDGFPIHLLYLDAVYVDLGWDDVRIEKVRNLLHRIDREIEQKRRKQLSGFETRPNIEYQKAFWSFQGRVLEMQRTLLHEMQEEFDAWISEDDKDRLDEIVLQQAGTIRILCDKRVKPILGISEEQTEKFTGIYVKHFRLMNPQAPPLRNGASILENSSKSEAKSARDAELLRELTDDQRIAYRKLIGRHFDESGSLRSLVLQGVPYRFLGLSFNESGTRLAGSRSNQLFLLNSATGEKIRTWKAHRGDISSLISHPDGYFLTSSLDRTVKSWKTTTERRTDPSSPPCLATTPYVVWG